MSDPPTLYTTTQAAELLGYSRNLVNRYARQMQLGTMYGSQRLLTTQDIEALRTRPDHRTLGLTNRWPIGRKE